MYIVFVCVLIFLQFINEMYLTKIAWSNNILLPYFT